MATTPPLSPSIAAAKISRVEGWIQHLSEPTSARTDALSPPSTSASGPSLKRKRATSSAPCTYIMSTRTASLKRRRRDSDTEVLPTHSVSAAGAASNASALVLNERNTFSPPGSQAGTSTRSAHRANSPSRDSIAVLASASPPTITEPSSGLKVPPPPKVRNVIERLEDGLDRGWIPGELPKPIEEDQDFGYQRIEPHAWGESTLSDPGVDSETRAGLACVLQRVKKIWLNARMCQSRGRDENAWYKQPSPPVQNNMACPCPRQTPLDPIHRTERITGVGSMILFTAFIAKHKTLTHSQFEKEDTEWNDFWSRPNAKEAFSLLKPSREIDTSGQASSCQEICSAFQVDKSKCYKGILIDFSSAFWC